MEIHGSRGAPLNDYCLVVQKKVIFSSLPFLVVDRAKLMPPACFSSVAMIFIFGFAKIFIRTKVTSLQSSRSDFFWVPDHCDWIQTGSVTGSVKRSSRRSTLKSSRKSGTPKITPLELCKVVTLVLIKLF